jgi:hypothetical protein
MQNSNLYFTLFQKISEHLTILLNILIKKEADRPPKVSDLQLAALYITSYISNTPIPETACKNPNCHLSEAKKFIFSLQVKKSKKEILRFQDDTER